MQMLKLTVVGFILFLAGCASPPTIDLPGGGVGYQVTCSGSTWDDCQRKAQELCSQAGDGVTYETVYETEDFSRTPAPRTMLFKCVRVGAAEPPAP